MNRLLFSRHEITETIRLRDQLRDAIGLRPVEKEVQRVISHAMDQGWIERDVFGLNPIVAALQTAVVAVEETGLREEGVTAILLNAGLVSKSMSQQDIEQRFGHGVARIIKGLERTRQLDKHNTAADTENFRNLLLSFAEDMRVILIMIASQVNLMRQIRDTEEVDMKQKVSQEASFLYAPLAHKLGLYKLKSELEDLSLKYLEHDAYYMIKEKLNATKRSRDAYIARFIGPIEKKLMEAGLRFHMKGRTKSIHSIWQKMKKQKCGFEGIYDLFAIRIILDSPVEKEKMQCWQVYSIVTDMYTPNPRRLRDWLSVPKTNGYESLHITVLGPENKWVEVQIRTERMDEVAEKGLAAHWRYKGIKGDGNIDEWLNNIRNALESNDSRQMMDQFKMDLYEDEVFVFTPKGDLLRFPKGATILDFAYRIHSAGATSQWRRGRNHDLWQPNTQARVGEYREDITGQSQNPSCVERNTSERRLICERNARTPSEEPQDGIVRRHPLPPHQKVGIQRDFRFLSPVGRRETRCE